MRWVRGLDQAESGLKQNLIKSMLIPSALMVLMGLVVLTGAAGMLSAVAEDKKERVFEMLLASATPLDIIIGKVLGSVAISSTICAVWVAGVTVALYSTGWLNLAPVKMLPWVFIYLLCQVTMLSALGAALGAATTSPREAQQLGVLLVLPTMLPFMLLVSLLDQPNSWRATALSLFPPFAPMVMMMRQAMPGGVPLWQPCVALLGIVVWAVFVTWAASRIFRIGLLVQGKRPSAAELARWVVRG